MLFQVPNLGSDQFDVIALIDEMRENLGYVIRTPQRLRVLRVILGTILCQRFACGKLDELIFTSYFTTCIICFRNINYKKCCSKSPISDRTSSTSSR